jgi:hypothetical protein
MRSSRLQPAGGGNVVYSLTWLPGVLRGTGLKVAECPGWEARGRREMGTVRGVMCHHTAGPPSGNMPSLNTLLVGRSDLPGPLSQLGLGRDGTYYVIAAGLCNHAGGGSWQGITNGNESFIGIEAENTGTKSDPWPEVQIDAYRRGTAAILGHIRASAQFCAGHKEYALPAGRKDDPSFSMDDFRSALTLLLSGSASPPQLIPASAPSSVPGEPALQTLRRGSTGPQVKEVQTLIKTEVDGYFGPKTETLVRQFQRQHDLVPDGIVGPETWAVLNASK